MKSHRNRLLAVALLVLAPTMANAQAVYYQNADGINYTAVSAANPLPVTGGGGGGGGGAVTMASGAVASGAYASGAFASGAFASGSVSDGAIVVLGSKADAKSTATDTTAVTIMQVLKEISSLEQAPVTRAVTIASGGVASGAYASGSFASGAFALGSGVDGWDVTEGAKADTAWTSGSGSVVAILKNIANGIASLVTAVNSSIPAGTNVIGGVIPTAAASGGASHFTGSITNTAVAVDASPGQLYAFHVDNPNASVCFLQVFNTAQGSVTVGTTAPVLSLGFEATGGAAMPIPVGDVYSTAITVAATTTRTGGTACGSNLNVNLWYK